MKIVARGEVGRAAWDALVEASSDAWLFHRWAWIDLETRHLGAADQSFALVAGGGRLAAVVPCYMSDIGLGFFTERLVHCGFHRHAGPAFAPGLAADEARTARSHALAEIVRLARAQDADRIHVAVQNLSPHALSPERQEVPFWVMAHGFSMGMSYGPGGFEPAPGMATTMVDQIVDLGTSPDTLFAELDEGCRRAVRKATAAGVSHVLVDGDPDLDLYWELAGRSAARTGESLPSRDYYEDLARTPNLAGKVRLHVARHEGRPVAALFTLEDKGVAHFLAGVSDPDALSLRVNDHLHWSAILSCRTRGLAHYRLGPCFPTLPSGWPVETVTRFKRKFGARPYTVIQGSLFLKPWRYREVALRNLERLCAEAS